MNDNLTDKTRKQKIMKVKELIKLLEVCDQDLPVYIYRNDGELFDFDVDDSISDRIDINISDEERYCE